MKKFALLFALVCVLVTGVFAQQDAVKIGPNPVTISARHCGDYVRTSMTSEPDETWGIRLIPIVYIDSEACAADPSTTYSNETVLNLKTTGGVDLLAKLMVCSTSSGSARGTGCTTNPDGGQYIALSTDATAPAVSDCAAGSAACTLTGEITDTGLGRALATYAHTNGQNTHTLSYTWTATGAKANIQKAAVFNALSSGTMIFENTFAPITLALNDQLQIVWTITTN